MAEESGHEITRLLSDWSDGDPEALPRLVDLVYPELRRIARRYLGAQCRGNTLQSTALVHEAYLKLLHNSERDWQDRIHFYAVSARIMRGLLVDHARSRGASKRGGGAVAVTLEEGHASKAPVGVDLLDLDRALDELKELDEQQARVVEMRYFGGMSIEETAEVLRISPATVKRDWVVAKAWIRRRIQGHATPDGA